MHELKTCSVVCLPLHSGLLRSAFFPHCTRFALEGKKSYTDLIRKLIQSDAMCEMSFHVRDLCKALSQLVHCVCWSCWTAFWTLLESSFSRISLMTMSLFSFPSAFDHQSLAVSLSLPNYFFNVKTFLGLICGFYDFPWLALLSSGLGPRNPLTWRAIWLCRICILPR